MNEPAPAGQTVFDLFDAAATAVVAVDREAVIRYVNPRARELFGFASDELLGRFIELLVPEARAAAHVALRDGYLEAPASRPLDARRDLRGRRKDGTEFAAEISLTPLDTGFGPWVAASVLDVSDRQEAEERAQRQSRTYLFLALLNEAVARADDETVLFAEACSVAVVHGGFAGAWVFALTIDDAVEIRASAGPLSARFAAASTDRDQAPDFTHPDFLQALSAGHPLFINDFSSAAGSRAVRAVSLGVGAFAALPLTSRGRTVAAFCLASERPDVLDDDLCALLASGAEAISLALDRFQANADLDRALSHRTELLRRLVNAQERERSRIAADVHDEPVQALAAVDLRLGLLERQLAEAAPELVAGVEQIHETITSVSDGLRHLLFELEPVSPHAHLTDLLEDAAAHIFELSPVEWTIANEPDPRELELTVATRTQVVRIAKEAMVNAAKHARATTVRIQVSVDDDGVTVEVADDGVGLPPGLRSSPPGHRGISGMLDRAEVAGGSLSVDSDATGTTVSVWLPRA